MGQPVVPTRLDVLAFLGVPDVASWASCSQACASDVTGPVGELLWNSTYDSSCRLRGPASAHIRALVARPCGEAAVDCRVAVYSAEYDAYLCGAVRAFDVNRNAYLVRYDELAGVRGAVEVWETEQRCDQAARLNPLLRSQNRFRFLTLPTEPDAKSADCPRPGAGLLRFGSWRDELRHTIAHTPARRQRTLCDHRDEVLFVTFSPCGTLLATCSRDRTTAIYRLDMLGGPVLTALLRHESTALRAHWWPEPPHSRITVSTGGPGERATAEVWDIDTGSCICKVNSFPFDVYAGVVRWPGESDAWALLAGGGRDFTRSGSQEMRLYQLPPLGPGLAQQEMSSSPKTARLLLALGPSSNYCHCPEPAPPGKSAGLVAALTGICMMQCDVVVLFKLPAAAGRSTEATEVELRTHAMSSRAVLSVRWAPDGGLLLANTRPRIGACTQPCQTAPALGTAIELMVLDPETFETLSIHGGHYAFTPSEAPFILYTEAWADNDLLASGGEDHCVHVWHRRHGRQLRRLEGHAQAVNAVSWSQVHSLLASASDDHTVILWACGSRDA